MLQALIGCPSNLLAHHLDVLEAAGLISRHRSSGDACPLYPGKRYEDWELDDPAGLDVVAVRPIRDEIRERVRQLLSELQLTAAR